MIRKAFIAALAVGALALGGVCAQVAFGQIAFAQSVTSAPAPTENLTRLTERVEELERLLREATGENERLAIELRRARADNERLQKQLSDTLAQQQAAQVPDAAQAPDAPAGDPAQQMRDATRALQMGRFAEAEAGFVAFVRANPQSADAPEARYFIGRTQVAQHRFDEAAETFVSFLRDLPAAPRAPDAWAMLGVSLHGMGKTAEACNVFRDLPVKYPRASAAARNIAASEAQAARCH